MVVQLEEMALQRVTVYLVMEEMTVVAVFRAISVILVCREDDVKSVIALRLGLEQQIATELVYLNSV